MFEDHYGFVENPFSLSADPRYLFKAASHASAVDLVAYALQRREPFMSITGGAGMGKTTLCRAMPDALRGSVLTAVVLEPLSSEQELLRVLLQGFGVVSRAQAARGALASVSTEALIDTLQTFLRSLPSIGAQALVVVDDTHQLSPSVLERLGTLSGGGGEAPVHVLLVGDTSLRDVLRTPQMRLIQQRISMRHDLQPLSRDETAAYLAHRLAVAGGGEAVSFSAGATTRVFGCTRGVPRLVNVLCERALAAACAERAARVLSGHVERAADALDLARPNRLLLAWAR